MIKTITAFDIPIGEDGPIRICVDLWSRVCDNAPVRVRLWLLLTAAVSAILTASCGSIVQSTRESSPLPHGSKIDGLAYWLPKGSIIIDGTWDKDAKDCSIKVGTLIEADTCSRWRLTRKVNHLFEDTVLLDVDPATGLLKTVNGTSEDKSAEIVATALQAAAKAMTFGAGAPVSTSALREEGPTPCGEPIKLTAPFHFKIPVADVILAKNNYCKRFEITGPAPAPSPAPAPPAPIVAFTVRVSRVDKATSSKGTHIGEKIDNKVIVDGIVVRAPAPYQITIEKNDPNLVGEQILFLPDPERIYYLPLDRTPFVKNETKIGLVNGVVQNVSVTRPSIILGIVGVPKTILEALVPLSSH